MSKLGQLALIPTKDHWKSYKTELAVELAKTKAGLGTALEFPAGPKQYPCLVAATLPPGDPTREGIVLTPRVLCCYVYLSDAHRLVKEANKAETTCHPVLERIPEDESQSSPVPAAPVAEVGVKYEPSQMSTLLLAVISELHAVGALKKDKLSKAIGRMEKWLGDTYTQNAGKGLIEVMERFWKEQNAS